MKKKIFFFLLLVVLLPNYVHAIDSRNNQLCIDTGEQNRYYKLTNKGKNVEDFSITYQDIEGTMDKNQNVIYPAGCFCSQNAKDCLVTNTTTTTTNNTPQCKKEYQFSVEAQGSYCSISGKDTNNKFYNFSLCPTQREQNAFSQISSSISFDGNNYVVKFDIPNEYKGKIIAKLVKKDSSGKSFMINKNGDPLPGGIATQYTSYQVENGISFVPGTSYYLMLALSDKSSGCNGVSLGYFQSAVPSTIPNTMYNNNKCVSWRSKYSSDSIGGSLVSECYDEYIQYNERNTIATTIDNKIKTAESLLSNSEKDEIKSSNLTCKFENNNKDINTNPANALKSSWLEVTGAGTYWGAFCTETMSIEYDDPKAVKAGSGFGYNAKMTIQRECTPIQLKKPKNLPTCVYAPSTNGPAHNNDRAAGPNTTFDQCVSNCDNGNYTQRCINTCYQTVYKNKNTTNTNTNTSNLTFSSDSYSNYLLRKTSTALYNGSYPFPYAKMLDSPQYYGGSDQPVYGYVVGRFQEFNIPISSSCVIITNDGANGCNIKCDGTDCYTEHGEHLYFADSCNNTNVAYEIYLNYPCSRGTSSYEAEIKKSENEYNLVVAAIQKFNEENTKKEKYELTVDEEYSKQKDGTYLEKSTTFTNSGSGNRINSKISVSSVTTTPSYNATLADDTNGLSDDILSILNKSVQKYAITRTIEVGIGSAYVSKVNGNEVLYNQTNSSTDTSLDKNDKYYSAQNKYFTQFDTKFVNNYRNWPYYSADTNDSTDAYTKNIHVRFYNIGSWNQWGTTGNGVNIDCLYGTDPGIICNDKDDCPEGTGVRYIFRPINLTDMFPNNRDPRFNWTGTIDKSTNKSTGAAILKEKSYYNDAVDPETLIKTIESKGESIYNVSTDSSEIDYEFVLTKENIRNIRSYNKHVRDYNGDGEKNYLDYNMSCYKNSKGQEICTSKFLDNINGNSGSEENSNFITYSVGGYGITERKSIAGCNNAINGTDCDTISK